MENWAVSLLVTFRNVTSRSKDLGTSTRNFQPGKDGEDIIWAGTRTWCSDKDVWISTNLTCNSPIYTAKVFFLSPQINRTGVDLHLVMAQKNVSNVPESFLRNNSRIVANSLCNCNMTTNSTNQLIALFASKLILYIFLNDIQRF